MQIKKIISLSKEEIQKILSKYVEKKAKSTVETVLENTEGGLEFHITPSNFDESGE